MAETLAELLRQVRTDRPAREALENQRPRRPMPRSMRPPEARLYDANPGVRAQASAELRRRTAADAATQRGQAYAPPRDQIAELGPMAFEMTGIPAAHRAGHAREAGDYGTMATELGMSALMLGGLATLRPGRAPAPRVPTPEPRLPVNPSREIGRASDGSVLPVRPSQPFRQSFVGGSADLREAAGMRGASATPAVRSGSPMDRLLHQPLARYEHARDGATVRQMQIAGRPMTMYDFTSSPALTNVRFHPMPDGETFAIAMSARGVTAESAMSAKAQVFADTISAIEHHAQRNGARGRGFRYLFTGETDAHTRLFRGLAERAEWPKGAVIHDTPAGFEISFDPARVPFAGELPYADFAHQPRYNPNLGQEGRLTLSDAINVRARQIASGATPRARPRLNDPLNIGPDDAGPRRAGFTPRGGAGGRPNEGRYLFGRVSGGGEGGGGGPFQNSADKFRAGGANNSPVNVNRERSALDDDLGLPDGPGEAWRTGWQPGLTQGDEDKIFIWAHDAGGNRGPNPFDGPFDNIEDARLALARMQASPRWAGYRLGTGRPSERDLAAWGLK